jgi:hypothetical protein
MSHHHDHEHDHHSGHESAESSGLFSETDKLIKMVEHWIHHNEEHSRSYRKWADRAREMGQEEAGAILEEVADGTLSQNRSFERMLALLKGDPVSR